MGSKVGSASAGLEFFARCAGGFEDVLAQELRALRMRRVRPQVGGVIFFGTLADAYRACLWLRSATRVQLVLARVPADTADALYQGVYDFAWEDHLPAGATIAVDAHGENPELRNTKFVALKVKDAICDRLREVRGARPDVDAHDPDVAVNVAVHPKKATVYLNLSGASLHRRGYRTDGVQTEAPLKETLAAGILLAAGWPQIAAAGGCLADPMCGSGTFSVEAALMAADVAPGLLRERWGFEGWSRHDQELWEHVRDEALQRRRTDGGIRIVAGDLDARAVDVARANLERAGVSHMVSLGVSDAADLARRLRALRGRRDTGGLMVANPPYGQRLLSTDELPQVRRALAAAMEALPSGWGAVLVTPDMGVDTALGRVPAQVVECHNGPIRVWVRLYDADARCQTCAVVSLAGMARKVPIAERNSDQFAARLRKVARERAKWARKAGVGCYRVYDADLPDYALSIDLYQGAGPDEGQMRLMVREHRRPAQIDAQRAARRLADAVAIAAATFDLDDEQVVTHPWRDARAQRDERMSYLPLTIAEDSCLFVVDLGRPEASLPLAQRSVRQLAGTMAAGNRVAALFATSGPALVHAARAGARSTCAVDGAQEWLDAVGRQMRDNGFASKQHRDACTEVRAWLRLEARQHHTYDLVICVAPDWLSARDAGGEEWDLQRDHVSLLRLASRVLADGGVVLFASGNREVRLDFPALEAAGLAVQNVSGRVVPHDFERSRETPRCFLVGRA